MLSPKDSLIAETVRLPTAGVDRSKKKPAKGFGGSWRAELAIGRCEHRIVA
jgi:hypothetical protein